MGDGAFRLVIPSDRLGLCIPNDEARDRVGDVKVTDDATDDGVNASDTDVASLFDPVSSSTALLFSVWRRICFSNENPIGKPKEDAANGVLGRDDAVDMAD